MPELFKPIDFRKVQVKNRIVVSPMCQYSSLDGFANDWHLVHLGSRAVGGAGLIFTEATAVSPEGRISPDDLGIWKDEHIPGLKRITDFIYSQGAVAGIQLAHAGRKASHYSPWKSGKFLQQDAGAWQTVGPSATPYTIEEPAPRAMTAVDIEKTIQDFQSAASRALKAGFQVIEIHAAHGYLVNEFLSPLSNQRNDDYGGSFENRCRLLMEIIDATREVWPADLPIFVRISAVDWVSGGWTIEDSVQLGRLLKEKDIDLVDCSSGGVSHEQQIKTGPLYQVPFAARVRREAGIATGAVGLITEARQAEEVIHSGSADLVFFARQLLRDPYFPLHAATELGADLRWPDQYARAKK